MGRENLRLFWNQFDINLQNMFTKANQTANILSYDDALYLTSSYNTSDIISGEKNYFQFNKRGDVTFI